MIILSKTVRRECRGAMYGVVTAFGALGAFIGVTLGSFVHDKTTRESLFLGEMVIASSLILIIFFSKIYKDREFERPARYEIKKRITIKGIQLHQLL